jgi:hypothetical protein
MKLFISYAHVDSYLVRTQIVDTLKSAGYDVWFDERLSVGEKWEAELEKAIYESDGFVAALTPEWFASKPCQWETEKAEKFNKPIFPILLQSNTKISEELKSIQYIDFSNGATGIKVAELMRGLKKLAPNASSPSESPKATAPTAESAKKTDWTATITIVLTLIGTLVAVFTALPEKSRENFFMTVGLLAPSETIAPTFTSAPSDTPAPTFTLSPSETASPTNEASATIAPSDTSIPTFTTAPSETFAPTDRPSVSQSDATFVVIITATPEPSPTSDGICYGTIVNRGSRATVLQILYLRPSSSSSNGTVEVGRQLIVTDSENSNGILWYQLEDDSGRSLGWVQSRYLDLGSNCDV